MSVPGSTCLRSPASRSSSRTTPPCVTRRWRPGPSSSTNAWTRSRSWSNDSPPGAAKPSNLAKASRCRTEHLSQIDPSRPPKSISRSRPSTLGSRAASLAVSTARRRSEDQTCSGAISSTSMRNESACSRPVGDRGSSLQPRSLPSSPDTVEQWRRSQTWVTATTPPEPSRSWPPRRPSPGRRPPPPAPQLRGCLRSGRRSSA